MDVKLIATKTCTHRPNLEREFRDIGVPYRLVFIEDEPQLAAEYHIRKSPTVVVDEEVIFSGQPTEGELRALLAMIDIAHGGRGGEDPEQGE